MVDLKLPDTSSESRVYTRTANEEEMFSMDSLWDFYGDAEQ